MRDIGQPAVEALAKSLQGLQEEDKSAKVKAAEILMGLGPEAEAAIPALVHSLQNEGEDPTVRGFYARVLGTIGTASLPSLTAMLNHPEPQARASAAIALRQIGPNAHVAILALKEALHDDASTVRSLAAAAMVAIDPHTEATLQSLKEMLNDPARDVRISVARSLGRLGPSAVPALIQTLKDDEEWMVRALAAETLGNMGADAKSAVPALEETLKDETLTGVAEQVTIKAAMALWAISPDAETVVPTLIKVLENRRFSVRAANALSEIGPEAQSAVPALQECLQDEDTVLRRAAEEALKNIQSE